MMPVQDFVTEARKWNLDDPAAALVFSDWLFEKEEYELGNLVRWIELAARRGALWRTFNWKKRLETWERWNDIDYGWYKQMAEESKFPVAQ